MPKKPTPLTLFTTLGGRVECPQCTATSKRSGQRCRLPALKGRTTCKTHGGRSTGARTPEGKARQAAAHTTHGRETNAARQARHAAQERLADLEAIGRELGMITGPRSRGRPLKRS